MGCASSKGIDNGSTAYRPPQYQQYQRPQQQYQDPYALSPSMIPPSTLPPGWISQFDPTRQRLYYIYPQTRQTTWTHPLGQAADAQELARFYQIQQLHQQQYGGTSGSGGYNKQFMDSYNRKGGLGSGAALALGVAGGAAVGLVAGSLLADGMMHHNGYYGGDGYYGDGFYGGGDLVPAQIGGDGFYGGGDIVPAQIGGGDLIPAQMGGTDFGSSSGYDFGGGDFGGGDFGGGGFGGGDFGGGF
ncbi:MAG: hypothetical protein BYD32DRAFT_421824 [Podila humilis]|nr:MAG: hypothetical protein BYD32DRAFT_421824 [Podila humilis]